MTSCANNDPASLFGGLKVSRTSVTIKLLQHIDETMYLGSSFRGLIGWQLLDLSCPFPARERPLCKRCIINEQCPCFILMEDKSPLPGLTDSPRPYILYPRRIDSDLPIYTLELTLVGESARFYPILLKAIEKGQRTGIARQRISYQIMVKEGVGDKPELKTSTLSELIDIPQGDEILVRLLTPLRLRKKGCYIITTDWQFLLETAARRIEALNVLYGGGEPLGKDRWISLSTMFMGVPSPEKEDIRWLDYSRRSNRQRREVPMGGVVGQAFFRNTPQWLKAWLCAASLLHVGKGAAMGLGRVELSSL